MFLPNTFGEFIIIKITMIKNVIICYDGVRIKEKDS